MSYERHEISSTPPKRGRSHQARAEFLENLAVLFGCPHDVHGGFADGTRPDVLRSDAPKAVLFVGEAKDSESPGTTATQIRLLGYMRWIKAFLRRSEQKAMLAVCFGTAAHTKKWQDNLAFLIREADLVPLESGFERFDRTARVVWYVFSA